MLEQTKNHKSTKVILSIIFLLVLYSSTYAQKVYKTSYKNEAGVR